MAARDVPFLTRRTYSMKPSTWPRVLLVLAAASAVPLNAPGLSGQETARTTTVVAGEEYAAGGFHRFLWGSHYRDAWTTEVEVEILDLGQFAGGLTPLSAGGRFQNTRSR